jgi:hypothetical protein
VSPFYLLPSSLCKVYFSNKDKAMGGLALSPFLTFIVGLPVWRSDGLLFGYGFVSGFSAFIIS